ncbi:hypothetical protein BT93_D2174 [Corymbia citriodora subsp. variegata]|nr:hypothetical protein BT93_D2174 [Corymbia citriodora subsp. variegata]
MASSTLLLHSRTLLPPRQNPNPLASRDPKPQFIPLFRLHSLPKPRTLSFSPTSRPNVAARAAGSSPPAITPARPPLAKLGESIRTVSSVLALAVGVSVSIAKIVQKLPVDKVLAVLSKLIPGPQELAAARELGGSLSCAAGPLFFAALRDRPSGYLNTPLTVVAAGLAKWLDIYSGVLMVRVLLSWFPNIPWERQPLSAIRDLCDPYLNLFRNIIPPIFDTLDVSPLLAFAVLGTLGSILNNSRGMY